MIQFHPLLVRVIDCSFHLHQFLMLCDRVGLAVFAVAMCGPSIPGGSGNVTAVL